MSALDRDKMLKVEHRTKRTDITAACLVCCKDACDFAIQNFNLGKMAVTETTLMCVVLCARQLLTVNDPFIVKLRERLFDFMMANHTAISAYSTETTDAIELSFLADIYEEFEKMVDLLSDTSVSHTLPFSSVLPQKLDMVECTKLVTEFAEVQDHYRREFAVSYI
jgi:hypothetical protein